MPSIVQTGAAAAFVSVDKTVMDADGADSCGIAITLVSNEGADNPLVGVDAADIVVSVSGTGNTVTQPTGTTNASGAISGASFVTTVEETKTVTVTVAGLALAQQPTCAAGGTITPPASGDPFFEDDFAGPGFNNANGFTWGGLDDTAVVTFDGAGAIRFRNVAQALGGDSSAEQRFNLGRNLSEVWIEYDLYLPDNFVHRSDPPSNNKFVALWATNYSSVGNDVMALTEFDRVSDTQSSARMLGLGEDYVDGVYSIRSDGYMNSDFLNASWAGTWRRIRLHWKVSSGTGVDDGIWEGWVGDTLMWRSSGFVFWYPGGNNFIRNGYLMGWANSGYAEQTDFYVRAFKAYDTDPSWGMA